MCLLPNVGYIIIKGSPTEQFDLCTVMALNYEGKLIQDK